MSASPIVKKAHALPEVRVLTLSEDEHLDSIVFRLHTGCVVQIQPGPTMFGKTMTVFTNHPESPKEEFSRSKYRPLPWKSHSINKGDDTAMYVEIVICMPGSFHFFVNYDGKSNRLSARASGYFLVDPCVTFENGDPLPLDCIQCQTYLSKCLGPLDGWLDTLSVSKEAGYNMIHFTPIQELGKSRSGYSLKNQLKLNSEFSSSKKTYTMKDVKNIIETMNKEWKVLSVTDIVLNHTANESPWLKKHPECAYNIKSCPHLRPAYMIDRAIYHFSVDIMNGKWTDRGIPAAINCNDHVEAMRTGLLEILFKPKVEEFFLIDIEETVKKFTEKIKKSPIPEKKSTNLKPLSIIQDPNFHRNKCSIDIDLAVKHFNEVTFGGSSERVNRSVCNLRNCLESLNGNKVNEIHGHLHVAINCLLGTVRYERLQDDGPKIKTVSKKHPIAPPYFTHHGEDLTLEEEEKLSYTSNASYLMAHNGWVMGDDPLRNFAEPGSNVYLRRELIAWGDSVKLRYGSGPEDRPYLWDFMRQYVEETARNFYGIRLDNCHSTPIHVAEYLLDCARRVRPHLYVFAELFTSSEKTDNIFVNRLGINSLVREGMAAPDSHEEGRLVYRYGGEPVGAFQMPPVRPLVPSVAHAIFYEMTHDNKSPCQTRTGWDLLPSAAVISMSSCAVGSTRGYEELVPIQIHVVDEERKYAKWSDSDKKISGYVNKNSGIIKCKKLINDLHFYLGFNGYNQVFVDQVTPHVVTITRHNPVTHKTVVLIAYTSFVPPNCIHDDYIRPLRIEGQLQEVIFEFQLHSKDKNDLNKKIPGTYEYDEKYINGIEGLTADIRKNISPSESALIERTSSDQDEVAEYKFTQNFKPGSVIAIRVSLKPHAEKAVRHVRSILNDFSYLSRISEIETQNDELSTIVKFLSLSDLNRILYRCDQEERDEGKGWGVYSVPITGPFVYCGLQGISSAMEAIRNTNDLGHPLCGNLRDGDWLMDYITGRLKVFPSTKQLGIWMEGVFEELKHIPRYLIPSYFDAFLHAVHLILVNRAYQLMSSFISKGSDFAKALALCSVEFCGIVESAVLPELSLDLEPPQPPVLTLLTGEEREYSVTLSAGLPHFCVGYMRNWGRDTFIALPGNLLITGRYNEARWIILAFAQTVRHGLIPNLLDGGPRSRFNCRDAVWFWLYAIQQYVNLVPNGHNILQDKVARLFPTDDSPPFPPGDNDQILEEVIHECLQRHFQGLKFRERNAGHEIDCQMKDEGFNNEIGVDYDTGFPYGGNVNNCGTWMDKMGSSEKAGNKGVPATPRDGSAVEIVGLCKSALTFLDKMHKEQKYSFDTVEVTEASGNSLSWTYAFWADKISQNFEKQFFISDDDSNKLVNRRGIYKDSVKASQPWADFQLRCNFPIALAVAPEIVTPSKAEEALKKAQDILLGPLGIKTLDPSDWAYRGDYDNGNDSEDYTIARGFNYHQGPEWLWPVGWFFKAKLHIAARLGNESLKIAINDVKALLASHFSHLVSSPWKSLPELTNSNGSFCRDSNPAQSWSTGCLLEVLHQLNTFQSSLQ